MNNPKKMKLTEALKQNQLDKGKIRGSRTQYYHFALATSIILLFTIPSSASTGWSQIYSQKVHPYQNISIGNITITDIQFSSPVTGHIDHTGKLVLDSFANPTIFLNTTVNGIQSQIILSEGQTYQDNKTELQITASGFTAPDSLLWEYSQYNPSATLSINTWSQELPSLSISINPQYSSIEYGKYSTITVKSTITNNINTLTYVDISPDFGSLSFLSNKSKQRISISPKSSETLSWSINIPKEYGTHVLKVSASVPNVTTAHPDGTSESKYIEFSSSTTIQITPPSPSISVQKIVPSRLYTCINKSTIIIISNDGIFDIKDLIITDSIPSGFESTNNKFIWNTSILKSKNQLTLHELLIPITPGSYTFEPTTITYTIDNQQYSSTSNTPKTQVISTGKSCLKETIKQIQIEVPQEPATIQNTSHMDENLSDSELQKLNPYYKATPNPTIIPQSITPKPTIPETISLPGFESFLGIIGLYAAHQLRRKLR